jgi:large repetitive protein
MTESNMDSRRLLLGLLGFSLCFFLIAGTEFAGAQTGSFTLRVVDTNGVPIPVGYKWLLEEDNTHPSVPGVPSADIVGLNIHKSHFPVLASGTDNLSPTTVLPPAPTDRRFFVSVLPESGYTMGGAPRAIGQSVVTVTVHPLPIPTAQVSILAFVDQGPINNAFDEGEQGLGGCTVKIFDAAGQMSQDAFGNPLGTVYAFDANGDPIIDLSTGTYQIIQMGNGVVTTLTQQEFDNGPNPYKLKVGEALVKFLNPGKYGVILTPPNIDDSGDHMSWIQTTTIEGTPTIDAWVKANEPSVFIEGFGTGFKHTVFGFVLHPSESPEVVTYQGQTFERTPWNKAIKEDYPPGPYGTITGTLRQNHFGKPPMNQGWFAGAPVPECWVGLNDLNLTREVPAPGGTGEVFTKNGRYIAQCNADSSFTIPGVPPGTYQLVWWDTPLDYLFGFQSVTVPAGGGPIELGDVLAFRWFGTLQGSVFIDPNQNGFRNPNESGISSVPLNLRFRDGSIYQATVTDISGEYEFGEVFPFFKWLIAEVGFTNHKPTGMTAVVDAGGQIPPDNGWSMPSLNKLNPQPQVTPPNWRADGPPSTTPVINPNTGNNLSRTETGPVLLEATQVYLNQTNVIDWGKVAYAPGENGGIAGIVFYATTRAENDPRWAVGETWEPGIPRIQVNLYLDADFNGIPDDVDGDGQVTLSDGDNHPLGWAEIGSGTPIGPEDANRTGGPQFNPGDAINVVWSDSFDDNAPTGCIQALPVVHGEVAKECYDSYGTWNQVRPGVFDGGYAFTSLFKNAQGSVVPWGTTGATETPLPAGNYIVEIIVPPGYQLAKEEDKNVDFGDEYNPSPLVEPAVCVGAPHLVPPYLSLLPALQVPAPFAGQTRPLCDRRQVFLSDRQNAAADFFLFTEVPKAARAFGFANNDLSAEFNVWSPNFGEKLAPAWIPVSFRDWTGKEVVRVYTDEFGNYNAPLPSTFTINAPMPSGVAPNVMTLILNDPFFPDGTPDPHHNPTYSVTPWTLQYYPGTTTYLDTPLIPQAAFAPAGVALDTNAANATPIIASVDGPESSFGPVMCTSRLSQSSTQRRITITSVGLMQVPNPGYDPLAPGGPGNPFLITRDYGFGSRGAGRNTGTVTLNGVPLAITSWSDSSITATLPSNAQTGRLMVRRSNGNWTEIGITFHIVNCSTTQILTVASGQSIQSAIDAANAGALILVAPGAYNENVIMNKPVRLQGAGAGSVFINANPDPLDRLQAWHSRIDALGGADYEAFLLKKVFYQNEAPGIAVIGQIQHPNGTVQNELPGTKVLNPGTQTLFTSSRPARIDGFTITGGKAGGAISVFAAARYLEISNNHITGNSGNDAGGIALGVSNLGFNQQNTNVKIIDNKIDKNGGVQGAGGIGLYEFSDNYLVRNNLFTGNFSRFNGGAISHWGYSGGVNLIQNNRILFNECHFGALLNQAGDGGAIYVAGEILGGDGAGNVTIDSNLIQGNLTGAGSGGGIRAFAINGLDVSANPLNQNAWYQLRIINNKIVNNVAALAGAGIALQDVARATISGNTIASNDSTATAALAFTAGQLDSNPQPAGIASSIHSAELLGFLAGTGVTTNYSNPTLTGNVIWQNRSFYNSNTNGVGSLAFSGYWDLNVLGSVAATDPHLNPQGGFLTSLTDPVTGFAYSGTNSTSNPNFVSPYFNTLSSATVIDEGGNNINVLISPLVPTGNYNR